MNRLRLARAAFKNMMRAAARDPIWAFLALLAMPFRIWKQLAGFLFILIIVTFVIGMGGRHFLDQMGFGHGSPVYIIPDFLTLLALAAITFWFITAPLILHFGDSDDDTHGSARFATDKEIAALTASGSGKSLPQSEGHPMNVSAVSRKHVWATVDCINARVESLWTRHLEGALAARARRDTMQRLWFNIDGHIQEYSVPSHVEDVMPGVKWGMPDELFTPSFWKYQSEAQIRRQRYSQHRLGNTLLEEVAVCLLGGYGIPAEMGMAAFERLRTRGYLTGNATEKEILALLSTPFEANGKSRRYRFAAQKASYVARSLSIARTLDLDLSPRQLRDELLELPGIGPKTASWIVRNHLDADDVAIIDVHLHRACVMMNVFDAKSDPAKQYFKLEDLFLEFAEAIKVRASILDAIIWDFMRRIGPTARSSTSVTRPAQLSLGF